MEEFVCGRLRITTALGYILFSCAVMGQEADFYTLGRCIEVAVENNLSLQGQRHEVEKKRLGVKENRAKLLPQIQAYAGYYDYVDRPATVLTSTKVGVPLTADSYLLESRSTKFQSAGAVQMTLPLYNQTLYTSLHIARKMQEISKLTYEKAREDLIVQVSQLFYQAQTTQEQTQLARDNIQRLTDLRGFTLAAYENGMALQVDVQRVDVNLENTTVLYNNSQSLYEQQLNLLRYVMGIDPDMPFQIEEYKDNGAADCVPGGGLAPDLYEIQLVEEQRELLDLQRKSIRQGYLPSLAFTGQVGALKYATHFNRLFNSTDTPDWYKTFYWGISLSLPVFDGLDKRTRLNKNKEELTQNRLQLENTKRELRTQYENAVNDCQNNQRNFRKQRDNRLLAESVYEVTVEKYREGVSSMTEVLQDEISMSNAQTNYVNAHYSYQVSELKLLKLSRQLDTLIY